MSPAAGMAVEEACWRVESRFQALVDQVVEWPRWKILMLVLGLTLLRAFPSYDALKTGFVHGKWRTAQVKFDEPLADMARRFPPESHESKLTFRMTVPVLAHALHLRARGVLICTALCGVALLWLAMRIAEEVTASRRVALGVAVAVGSGWAGLAAFWELRGGYYDAVALVLLMVALDAARPGVALAAAFAAAWTDERAAAAALLVAGFHALRDGGAALEVVGGVALYGATRSWMATVGGMTTELAGVGGPLFGRQLNVLPLALWSGLGGGWIFVAGGAVAAVARRTWGALAGLLLLVTGLGVAGLCVVDTTRSVAYLLPAVFVGLELLRRSERVDYVERLAAAAALTALAPSFYLEGSSCVVWLYPLPVQAARWLLG